MFPPRRCDIDNAPFKGVLPLAISSSEVGVPVLGNPTNHGKAIALTLDQFKFGWANNSDDDEARELYETFHVPASGVSAVSGRGRKPQSIRGETRVDSKNPDRGPLLIIAGDADNTVRCRSLGCATDL